MIYGPKKNTAFVLYLPLVTAGSSDWLSAPTIEAADFTISKDGGAFTSLTNSVTVSPSGGPIIKFDLTATEMNADCIVIKCVDNAGSEWHDTGEIIFTTTYGSGSSYPQTGDAYDITNTRLPAALVGGRIDANLGAISTDATAADTLESILDGGGGTITADLSGSVNSVTTAPTASTIADAVWDEALSGHLTAGTTGKALSDSGSAASASSIADAVWDEAISGHATAGTTGASLTDAAADALLARKLLKAMTILDTATTPWSVCLVEQGTGSAGSNFLDGTILRRAYLYTPAGGQITSSDSVVASQRDS